MKINTPNFFLFTVITIIQICYFCASDTYAQSNISNVSWDDVLEQEADWYNSEDAIRIADYVLLYQHESGGWPKNMDMARDLTEADKSEIRNKQEAGDTSLSDITIDNGATLTPMRYLARVFNASDQERFRDSFIRGLSYLLEAQYENGGWPQYYPLRDGYYSNITFNDGAMIGVMRLLREVAQGKNEYAFLDSGWRNKSAVAIEKGLDVILETQLKVDGKLTAWCAQYDPETMEPAAARSYELISLSGSESVGIVEYLLQIEDPNPRVIQSIESAVQWFEKVKLTDIRVLQIEKPSLPRGYDRVVAFNPTGAKPMWARFYEIGTNYPIFVDRSGTVHYAFSELPYERRVGYSWLGSWAYELLEDDYPDWRKRIK